MTTIEAAKRIGISPIVVARHCRTGKIRASYTAKGRIQREWHISEAALQHYLESRTGSTRSSRAKAGWKQRRQTAAAHCGSPLPSHDAIECYEQRASALDGDRDAHAELQEHSHLVWWWNREKGVVVGNVDVENVKRYASQVYAKRPPAAPVPAYRPEVG